MRSILEGNRDKSLWGGKKACVTLSFDCDYPEDVEAIPAIVDMLKPYRYKASFAAVGYWVEKFPREHAAVIEHGHELMNHTWSHPDNELLNPGRKFRYLPKDEKSEELLKCHEVCRKMLGYEPIGMRVPHFKHLFSPDIYEIISEAGYRYSSSTWLTNTPTRGLPFVAPNGIAEFPLTTCPKHPFTVFDTWHSLNAQRLSHRMLHRGPQQYLELFKELLVMARETGSYLNIYMDPLDIKKIPGFREMLDLMAEEDLDVVTYEEYLRRGMPMAPH
ncbi:MAG: polysaccharide deacetylase family protein [Betaproteobacteria bacterium]|nr:polysaccharide deacetylase family protein [Betaproteobacteria bacterium]